MKISSINFKEIMEKLSPVVTTSKLDALKYIKVKCEENILKAIASDGYIAVQYQCKIDEPCNETFYLSPIKPDKKYIGDVEIKNEGNFTVVIYDNTIIQINNQINYPNIDNLIQNKCYVAKTRLSKKQLIQLLKSCGEHIDIYLDDRPNKTVYIESSGVKGLITPIRNEEW